MSVIEEAIRLVHGARQDSYGHPYDDFSRTGRLWGAILGIDPVPPHLVALCMIAVKVSREVNAPKADNLIDIAGYAEALALVREKEAVTVANVTVPGSVTVGVTATVTANSSSSSPSSSSASASKQSTASTAHAREDYPTVCPRCVE